VVTAVFWIETRFRVDDPVGAFAVHGVCGAWGALSLGLFADGTYPAKAVGWNGILQPVKGIIPALLDGTSLGVKNGPLSQMGAQVIDAGVGFLWAFGITFVIFIIAKRFMQIRVSPEVEIAGTDEGEFGQVCYPDFVLRAETHTGITTELDAGGGKTPSGAGVGSEPA